MEKLTRGEQHCILVIEKIGFQITTMSINEISQVTNYSPATINRLVKKLGFKNIIEYKQYVSSKYQSNLDLSDFSKQLSSLYNIKYDIEFLELSKQVENASIIHIIAKEISRGPAYELAIALDDKGYSVMLHEKCKMLVFNATKVIKKKDILIIISYSGVDEEINTIAQQVKNHTFTALFTVIDNNPMIDKDILVIRSQYPYANATYKLGIPLSILIHQFLMFLDKKLVK